MVEQAYQQFLTDIGNLAIHLANCEIVSEKCKDCSRFILIEGLVQDKYEIYKTQFKKSTVWRLKSVR